MCCGKKRSARYSGAYYNNNYGYGCGSGYGYRNRGGLGACSYPAGGARRPGLLTLIEGIQQMRLASQQQQQQQQQALMNGNPAPAAAMTRSQPQPQQQTQGTIFDVFEGDHEKKEMLGGAKEGDVSAVNFEVLPTYEEVASDRITRETTGPTRQVAPAAPSVTEPAYPAAHASHGLPTHIVQTLSSHGLNLNEFAAALTSYREGDCCAKGRARRAAKKLVKELVGLEVTRLESTQGTMSYKQRRQVKTDLEPVETALMDVVRSIRRI